MKNKNFTSFLLSLLVLVCSAILIFANEDQNETQLQSSSITPGPDGLPKVIRILQLRKFVTNGTTEETSEAIIETPLVKNETEVQPSTTETTEDSSQNVTTESSVLPKRQAVTSVSEEFFQSELVYEPSYVAPLTLERLENYSCFDEASTFGHKEAIGFLVHEIICELRKLEHYFLIGLHNLKAEFKMEVPVEIEEAIILLTNFLMSDAIPDTIEQGIMQLEAYLENPEHLNELLDAVEKCVPMSNIHETVGRLRIAFTNFFIHLQGFIITFEPHQSIENFIEILKKFEQALCVLTEKLLNFFNINLETETNLLVEYTSLVGSFLKKFSFDQTIEENLAILEEFVDTLQKTYKQYHDSESSESIIDKVYTAVSTYISKLLPKDFNVTIVQVELPDNNVGTLSCGWQVMNETSSTSPLNPSYHNLTSFCKRQLSSIFEKEAELFSELSAPVELLHKNLSPEYTVEHHLTALKEFIDSLSDIYKKYYDPEYSESVIDKMLKFISTLLPKDFDVPLFHFKPSDGSVVVVSCSWQVTNESSSSSSLFSPQLNLASLVVKETTIDRSEDKTQSMTLAKLLVSDNSMPFSVNDFSELFPIGEDSSDNVPTSSKNDVPSSVEDILWQFSESTVPSSISTSNFLTPNYGSPAAISSTISYVDAIRLPNDYSSTGSLLSKTTLPESTTKFSVLSESISVNNDALSSSANVQPSDESIPLPAAPENPEIVSPDLPTQTVTVPSTVSPNHLTLDGINIQDKQDPPVSSYSENTAGSSDNNPVSSFSGKPTDSLTNNPPIVPFSPEEPADLSINNPPIASPTPEELADLLSNDPSIVPIPEQPIDLSTSNLPGFPSLSEKLVDPVGNNPSVSSPSVGNPIDPPISFPLPGRSPNFSPTNPQIPVYLSRRPTYHSGNNPSIYPSSPERPTDFPVNNLPIYPSPPVRPADFPDNNPLIPSYFSINSPPGFPAPIDFSSNNQPVFPLPPERSTDFLDNNQPIFPLLPDRPVDFSGNSPSIFPPTDLPVNPPTFLHPSGFSSNSPSSPERPIDFFDNEPIFPPVEKSSPSVLFPNYGRKFDNNYDKPPNSYAPPSYLLPASDIVPNLPHYPPLSETYANYLESADAFYKSLYSYLQYGNPAVAPPPSVSNKISELLARGFPPSLPTTMDNPNLCGTSAFLPALSGLNNLLKNGIRSSQLPLYLPRKEIASALGNTVLSPGDLIVILPKNGVGLIGQVIDTFSPIYFKAYEVKTIFTNPQDGIKIWHLRSGDFRNPECEQQLESLFQH